MKKILTLPAIALYVLGAAVILPAHSSGEEKKLTEEQRLAVEKKLGATKLSDLTRVEIKFRSPDVADKFDKAVASNQDLQRRITEKKLWKLDHHAKLKKGIAYVFRTEPDFPIGQFYKVLIEALHAAYMKSGGQKWDGQLTIEVFSKDTECYPGVCNGDGVWRGPVPPCDC
jgi:hypothetical protein